MPGQALIRAFQREPTLLSFIPDILLEEGYKMKPEGKYCTTGRPRLSRQLRPPQGVNYTQTARHFRKRFLSVPQERAQLGQPGSGPPAAYLLWSPGTCLPRGSDGQRFISSSKGRFGHQGCVPTRVQFPLPHTVPKRILQHSGPLPTSPGYPTQVFLSSVACPPLPIQKPWSTL